MKNKKVQLGTLIAVFALFTSCNAFAQSEQRRPNQEPPSIDEIFEELDADEDGKLSKKEIKGPLKNDFDEIDSDEDGFLTKEELENAPKPKGRKPRE